MHQTEGVGTSGTVLLDNIEIDTLKSVGISNNLHSRNVVHRDVKGDNYLMDRKDTLTFEWWGKNLGPGCRVCREVGSCLKWKSL